VVRHEPLIKRGGRVLDLAAGHGRQALYLAAQGLHVVAVDRDAAALATLAGMAGITTRVVDLESASWPLAGERFDAVVGVHYLHRPRFAELLATLEPEGVFIYETFARGNEAYGKPSNPAFLLAPDELLQRVSGHLCVVAFEQGFAERSGTTTVVQRVAAVGSARKWPPRLAGG
jgi:SAM-dependent methyltransferase